MGGAGDSAAAAVVGLGAGVDAGVLWLRETLARLGGENQPANPSPLYDSALETRVREFQRAHMLTVDGIVGARTQVAMIADLNVPGTPLLAAGH